MSLKNFLKTQLGFDCDDCDEMTCENNPRYNSVSNFKININLGGVKMNTLKTNQVTEEMLRKPGTLFYVGDKAAKLVQGWRLSLGDFAICLNEDEVPEGKWTKNLRGKLLSVIDYVVLPQDTDEYRTLLSELVCGCADADDFKDYMFKIEDYVPFADVVKAAITGKDVIVDLNGDKTTFANFRGTLRDIVSATAPSTAMIAYGKWTIA